MAAAAPVRGQRRRRDLEEEDDDSSPGVSFSLSSEESEMEPEEERIRYSQRLRGTMRRRYEDDGISDDEIEGKRTFDLEEKLSTNKFNSTFVIFMEGKDFTVEYIQRGGLRDPLIFRSSDGLGIKMPDPDFSVNDVRLCVGSRRMVDVMDVNTQRDIEMSMAQWARYYETPEAEREKLYNVISLEFSHTKLENLVQRPATVDLIDWVDNMWPRHLKESQTESTNAILEMQYPKVQKYCLMSVKGCYTDFHVDFGGTSVWYHIHRGGKIFWLIPPTPQNLELYENWLLSGKQGDIFLGDRVSECQRIELKQGYTFVIPSGWIHAVYTPMDTLVFGGNFLHSFNIPMQLRIYSIEDRTRVPNKFRYPFYYEMCWYVLERYVYCITSRSHLTKDFQKESLSMDMELSSSDSINMEEEEEEEEDAAGKEPRRPITRRSVLTSPVANGANVDYDELGRSCRSSLPALKKSPSVDSSDSSRGSQNGQAWELHGGSPRKSRRVHLTQFELEGLRCLVDKLESLPLHKKCVPTGIEDEDALIADVKLLLEEYANSDPKLALTGIPIVQWPKRDKLKLQARLRVRLPTIPITKPHTMKPTPRPTPIRPTMSPIVSGARRRRVRCRKCKACMQGECGMCHYCRDMKKFGGPGRMKQSCVLRQCLAPRLPHSVTCALCGEVDQNEDSQDFEKKLMECCICNEIVHPGCLQMDGEGLLNDELPNCWECPKCYQGDDTEKGQGAHWHARARLLQKRRALPGPSGRQRAERTWQCSARWQLLMLPSTLPYRYNAACRIVPTTVDGSRAAKKRKVEESDDDMAQAKVLRPLRSCEEPLTPPPNSPTPMLQLIHDPVSPRGVVTRSSPGAGPSEHHSASRDERFKRRQLLRLQATERTIVREKENNPSGKKELSEVEKAKLHGSYLTVTLQRPTKDVHGTSIVPKLQAITASSANLQHSPRVVMRHTPARMYPRGGGEDEAAAEEDEEEEDEDDENMEEGGAARLNGRGGRVQEGEESWMQREVWMSVFRYLTRRELCECMRVCKTWYKWCCDKRLWTKIDLSRCKSITPQALSGIIKRQPVSLDLSWTNISKKQLTWLVNRLPGLKDLILAGCSWSAVCALSTSSCPLLRTLDLRWAVGIKDPQIRDLLTPPTDKPSQDNRSKLRNMIDFRLAGLDITDATLRLIIRHMPLLSRLDLSHCNHLTDQSANLLTAVGSSTRNSLTELNMAGCNKLTDQALLYLRRISNVTLIDLRGCKQITRKACEHFISDLSINSLYCLSDEKLIQKIS
ncbi:lysine-specific demethylase 2A isoform X1 [Tympanuchus pallidicinctus]|uniref:lysine-specific demethylase 2A isoform X1 n=1 Tax=Tympanuchus pallidicinctus TaxID=109042 RepID=UPI002286E4E1|nr:lysine-specific demethylase 2A isoform X1 [Tympanuchus pallidicinctus]